MKTTPEEDRLATVARLYGSHPDNTVAWKKLCEAAVEYARSIGASGPRPLTMSDFGDGLRDIDVVMRHVREREAYARVVGEAYAKQAATAAQREREGRKKEERKRRRAEEAEFERRRASEAARNPVTGKKDDDYPF